MLKDWGLFWLFAVLAIVFNLGVAAGIDAARDPERCGAGAVVWGH